MKTADQNLKQQISAVQNRIEARNLMERRYQHALSNKIEVLENEIAVLQQQQVEIQARYDRTLAVINLTKALGGSYCAECLPLIPRGP